MKIFYQKLLKVFFFFCFLLTSQFGFAQTDYYWVGAGATNIWTDENNWSDASGGTPGSIGIPNGPLDNVFFDINSFQTIGETVRLTETQAVGTMDWTGATNSPIFEIELGGFLIIEGAVTFIQDMQLIQNGQLLFQNNGEISIITSGGQTLGNISFSNPLFDDLTPIYSTWEIADDLQMDQMIVGDGANISTLSSNATLTVNSDIQFTLFSQGDFGFSPINLGGSWVMNSGSINFVNASLLFEASTTAASYNFQGGGAVYGLVSFQGQNNYTITGENTFTTLSLSNGVNVNISYFEPQTTNSLFLAGENANLVTLRSDDGVFNSATINLIGEPNVSAAYANIEGIVLNDGNGGQFTALASNDQGGNSGWQFISFVYFEDFALTDGGWFSGTIGGPNSWQYGVPGGNIPISEGVWATNLTGDFAAEQNSFIRSPLLDFTGVANPTVSLSLYQDMFVDLSSGGYSVRDIAILEYSTDEGASWILAGTGQDDNWYNVDLLAAEIDFISPNSVTGTDGWSFSPSGWQQYSLSLPELAGAPNVEFRLRFVTNTLSDPTGFEGVALDDFGIYDLPVLAPNIIYVDANALGDNSGSDWANAYNGLQDALSVAQPGDEIWMAAGVYTPTVENGDRSISFDIPVGNLKIYGGFQGIEEGINERTSGFETILSGDLNGDDGSPIWEGTFVQYQNNEENSLRVITVLGQQLIRIDGVTISGGNATGTGVFGSGSALYVVDSDVLLNNVNVTGNRANNSGGAIFASLTDATNKLSILKSTFSLNSGTQGGAVFSNDTELLAYRNEFINNNATTGGAMNIQNSSIGADLFLNKYEANTTGSNGGALLINSSEVVSFGEVYERNETIGGDAGGAVRLEGIGASLRAINNTYVGNIANNGSVFDLGDGVGLVLHNSILWGNGIEPSLFAAIIQSVGDENTTINISNSIVELWDGGTSFGSAFIISNVVLDEDPLFNDPDFGDYGLLASSSAGGFGDIQLAQPFAQDLLDENENGNFTELIPFDINQNPRLGAEDRLDAGALQFQGELEDIFTIERDALIAFYNATSGEAWTNNENWLSEVPVGEWFGVDVDMNGRVSSIVLNGNNLVGFIPVEIGDLTALQSFFARENQLSGELPESMGNLINLSGLDLFSNQLTGTLSPTIFSNLTSLSFFTVGSNQLTGTIPLELSFATNLTNLYLNNNAFSGTVPEELGNLSLLVDLWLQNTGLEGDLPLTFTNLSSLQNFNFSNTTLCEPNDAGFQTWREGVAQYTGSGLVCGELAYPQDFAVEKVSGTQVVIKTKDNINELPAQIFVEMAVNEGSFAPIADFVVEGGNFRQNLIINDLSAGNDYFFRAYVEKDAQVSIFTDVVSITLTPAQFEVNTDVFYSLLPQAVTGMAWGDYNQDGLEDLMVGKFIDNSERTYLFENQGGNTFVERADAAGISSMPDQQNRSISWGDFDNDGWQDLLMLSTGSPYATRIFYNNRDGSFTPVNVDDGTNFRMYAVATGDFNQDGLLDFVISLDNGITFDMQVYLSDLDLFMSGELNHFQVTTYETNNFPWNYSVADYDGDGDLDIFAPSGAADASFIFEGNPEAPIFNKLYRNDGNGVFEEVSVPGLTDVNNNIFRSGIWVDIDQDGDLDLYVSGMANNLWLNDGSGGLTAGTPLPIGQRSAVFEDFDNDGDLDIFSAESGQTFFLRNDISEYVNVNEQPFTIVDNDFSRGATSVDFNNDGYLDLAFSSLVSAHLYENTLTSPGNWAKVKLNSKKVNNSAIGAIIQVNEASNPAKIWTHQISGQNSTEAQNSMVKHFGVGPASSVDILVKWPDGAETFIIAANVNEIIEIDNSTILDRDSVALIDMYRFANGANWTSKTNWYLADVATWEGIVVFEDRVTEINLPSNNIGSALPESFSQLDGLTNLDLSDNELQSLVNLGLLNFSTNVNVSGNRLLFDDIVPNIGSFDQYIYAPQKPFGTAGVRTPNLGDNVTLSFPDINLGEGTVYQWYLGETLIEGANAAAYTFTTTGAAQNGVYTLEATRPDVPDLILVSEPITVDISLVSRDLQSLLDIYNATGGANWTPAVVGWNAENQDVSTWTGVTIDFSTLQVVSLVLPNRNLVGNLPPSLLTLEELTILDLSGNAIESVPNLSVMPNLISVNLSSNSLTSIPNLSTIENLISYDISDNNLTFAQIVPILTTDLIYFPQKPYGVPDSVGRLLSQSVTLETQVDLTTAGNVYQWRRGDEPVTREGSDQQVFTLEDIVLEDAGLYRLAVTNPAAAQLTLLSDTIRLTVVNEYPVNERDSLALRTIYNAMGGAGWTNRANWMTDSLKKWQGVTLTRGNVSGLNLPDNNVSGTFPNLAGDQLNNLETLNLSGNQGIVFPANLTSMTGLQTLNLSDMELARLPGIPTPSNLTSVNVANNALHFADIEPFIGVGNLTYSPQRDLGEIREENVDEGSSIILSYGVRGTNLRYRWIKDGEEFRVETGDGNLVLDLSPFQVFNNGEYRLEVTRQGLGALTLQGLPVTYTMNESAADRAALRSIYNQMGGTSWTNSENWMTDAPLAEWENVTAEAGKVREIDLSNNLLTGALPALAGFELSELISLDISGNEVEQIPSFDGLARLTSVNVADNFLQFGSLESQSDLGIFTYIPQKVLFEPEDVIDELGRTITLSRPVSGSANVYSWTKNGDEFGTGEEIVLADVAFSDEGDYAFTVTNENAQGLILEVAPLSVFVASRERDIAVLQRLFDELGGDQWDVPDGWRENPIAQDEVTLNDGGLRVVGIDLSNKGLAGQMPRVLRTMTDLVSIDLSGNDLTFMPRLTNLANLTSLNVSNNRLQYLSLQNNIGIQEYIFDNQAKTSADILVRQPQGSIVELTAEVSGANLQYEWYFNETPIDGATERTLVLDHLVFEDMGIYHATVRNPEINALRSQFELQTGDFTVEATANITGELSTIDGDPYDVGQAVLFRIAPIGQPYIPIDTSNVVDGNMLFNDILLGDYMIRVVPEIAEESDRDPIPTYHLSAVTFDAADTVFLRENDNKDVIFQFEPDPLNEEDDGQISGAVELDDALFPPGFLPADAPVAGRTKIRKRVARVGVSFSRSRSTIRGQEDEVFEFIAYAVTDENGEFVVENLPDGMYRVNFDFPGIPTDPTSFVEFELGQGGTVTQNQIELAADITPTGIIVNKIEETFIRRQDVSDVKAYPVPFDHTLHVDFFLKGQPKGEYELNILNISGQVLRSERRTVTKGLNQVEILMPELQQGVYLFMMLDENRERVFTGKVVKE